MPRVKFSFGFYLYLSAALLILPLSWFWALILSAALHECGHMLTLRFMGFPVESFTAEAFGARIKVGGLSAKEELICAASGPLVGVILVLLYPIMPKTSICALVQTVFNLLPVGTFDGARILRCVKMLRN